MGTGGGAGGGAQESGEGKQNASLERALTDKSAGSLKESRGRGVGVPQGGGLRAPSFLLRPSLLVATWATRKSAKVIEPTIVR